VSIIKLFMDLFLQDPSSGHHGPFAVLNPIRRWLNQWSINDLHLAHRICKLIPSQCPFERDVKFLGRVIAHIPPLCKLNPLFDEVVNLRFRALCYLADECGEDVSQYC
jgi:Mo-dependent nitrogenase C-terminus